MYKEAHALNGQSQSHRHARLAYKTTPPTSHHIPSTTAFSNASDIAIVALVLFVITIIFVAVQAVNVRHDCLLCMCIVVIVEIAGV